MAFKKGLRKVREWVGGGSSGESSRRSRNTRRSGGDTQNDDADVRAGLPSSTGATGDAGTAPDSSHPHWVAKPGPRYAEDFDNQTRSLVVITTSVVSPGFGSNIHACCAGYAWINGYAGDYSQGARLITNPD